MRSWGGWPPKEFESLTAEEKKLFWKEVGACETKEEQEKLVLERLSKVVEETRCGGTGGEYLPLSVYATRGFDTTMIEELCDDKKPSKMFGTVYRVDIEYQTKETKEKRIREAILKSVQERRGQGGRKVEQGEGHGGGWMQAYGGFMERPSKVPVGAGAGGGGRRGAGGGRKEEQGEPTVATKK